MRRIKFTYKQLDNKTCECKVIDVQTGELFGMVQEVHFSIDTNMLPVLTIKMIPHEVEIEGDVEQTAPLSLKDIGIDWEKEAAQQSPLAEFAQKAIQQAMALVPESVATGKDNLYKAKVEGKIAQLQAEIEQSELQAAMQELQLPYPSNVTTGYIAPAE